MITCKKTWFAVFLSTAFAFAAFAQKPQDYASSGFLTEPDLAFYGKTYAPYKIKAQFVGGWIYPHDKNTITPLVNGPALGAEIAFEWGMDGSKGWHRDYNLPDVEPTFHPIGDLSNVMRNDAVAPARDLSRDAALGNACSTRGDSFRVPSILGEGEA